MTTDKAKKILGAALFSIWAFAKVITYLRTNYRFSVQIDQDFPDESSIQLWTPKDWKERQQALKAGQPWPYDPNYMIYPITTKTGRVVDWALMDLFNEYDSSTGAWSCAEWCGFRSAGEAALKIALLEVEQAQQDLYLHGKLPYQKR